MYHNKEELMKLLGELPLNSAQRELANKGLQHLSSEEVEKAFVALSKAKQGLEQMEEIRKVLLSS